MLPAWCSYPLVGVWRAPLIGGSSKQTNNQTNEQTNKQTNKQINKDQNRWHLLISNQGGRSYPYLNHMKTHPDLELNVAIVVDERQEILRLF